MCRPFRKGHATADQAADGAKMQAIPATPGRSAEEGRHDLGS
jgi:hypothetical protein